MYYNNEQRKEDNPACKIRAKIRMALSLLEKRATIEIDRQRTPIEIISRGIDSKRLGGNLIEVISPENMPITINNEPTKPTIEVIKYLEFLEVEELRLSSKNIFILITLKGQINNI